MTLNVGRQKVTCHFRKLFPPRKFLGSDLENFVGVVETRLLNSVYYDVNAETGFSFSDFLSSKFFSDVIFQEC